MTNRLLLLEFASDSSVGLIAYYSPPSDLLLFKTLRFLVKEAIKMNASDLTEYTPPVRSPLAVSVNSGPDKHAKLFEQYAKTHDPSIRDLLLHRHERIATYLASKFAGRGEPFEDLVQVARLGLIKSFDRFDPSRDIKFATYATATIVGEIQRYFRDTAWRIKVPRAMQKLNRDAAKAKDALTGRLGRRPTVAEVAREIGATEEATLEAIELSSAYSPDSLDSATTGEGQVSPAELYGVEDVRIEAIVNNSELNSALSILDVRDQSIVTDYYFNEMSEARIAKRLSISQMQVSRLKKQALSSLKMYMLKTRRRETE